MLDNNFKTKWKIRRRIVIFSLIFCSFIITHLVFKGEDTELNKSIANGLILLAGSIISSYIFGATWDDKGKTHEHKD